MHLEDPIKAISEMRRVTKNGGRVVAIEPNYASFSFFDSVYDTIWGYPSFSISVIRRVR